MEGNSRGAAGGSGAAFAKYFTGSQVFAYTRCLCTKQVYKNIKAQENKCTQSLVNVYCREIADSTAPGAHWTSATDGGTEIGSAL